MKMPQNTQAVTAVKPSIFRDAMMGLMTSVGIGIIASVVFVLVILFLSSNALANVPGNQYSSGDTRPTHVHQGKYPLFDARNKGEVDVAGSLADTDYFDQVKINIVSVNFCSIDTAFPANQVDSPRPNILTAHPRPRSFVAVSAPESVQT